METEWALFVLRWSSIHPVECVERLSRRHIVHVVPLRAWWRGEARAGANNRGKNKRYICSACSHCRTSKARHSFQRHCERAWITQACIRIESRGSDEVLPSFHSPLAVVPYLVMLLPTAAYKKPDGGIPACTLAAARAWWFSGVDIGEL